MCGYNKNINTTKLSTKQNSDKKCITFCASLVVFDRQHVLKLA